MQTFLMYRVELKVELRLAALEDEVVPNVPCGVERSLSKRPLTRSLRFLMYRVELKGSAANSMIHSGTCS